MQRFLRLAAVLAATAFVVVSVSAQQDARRAPLQGVPSASDVQKTVSTYCVTCHNDTLKTGGLALDRPQLADVAAHPDVWEKVIRKVRTGMMPPAGAPRPNAAERDALLTSLAARLDEAAKARPNPGRPLLHRLNRAEYANAIRDLLALDVDVST